MGVGNATTPVLIRVFREEGAVQSTPFPVNIPVSRD
jgi:hypothetical protein